MLKWSKLQSLIDPKMETKIPDGFQSLALVFDSDY